jgi:polyhydroxybutyrate depolymerase
LTLRVALAVILLVAAIAGPTSLGDAESTINGPPYEVYRPAGLSKAKPVPLVIGIGGSATRDGSGLNSFADRYGFVAAYPYPFQINVPPNEDASQTARIKYISDIIDELQATQNIDPTRVYVTGASKSGIESYRVACRLADKVTAIGSVAGALLTKEFAACHPTRPISVMEVHGTADTAVPYGGNQFYEPAATTMAFFRKVDGCPTQSTVSTRGRVAIETWGPCKARTAVRLITYTGGDHGWPRNNEIDTTAELWSFFSQHSSAASGAAAPIVTKLTVRSASRRRVVIRLTVNQDATVRANVTRAGRTVGGKLFHVTAGAHALRLALSSSARSGTYRLRLAVTGSDGSKQSLVRSFHVRG